MIQATCKLSRTQPQKESRPLGLLVHGASELSGASTTAFALHWTENTPALHCSEQSALKCQYTTMY